LVGILSAVKHDSIFEKNQSQRRNNHLRKIRERGNLQTAQKQGRSNTTEGREKGQLTHETRVGKREGKTSEKNIQREGESHKKLKHIRDVRGGDTTRVVLGSLKKRGRSEVPTA